jgi:opacity protein-like surface antigen
MRFKKLSVFMMLVGTTSFSSFAQAAVPGCDAGFYVGGQVGYGEMSSGNNDFFGGNNGGFAGRPYIGYQFNQFFGAETGYTFFTNNNNDKYYYNGAYYSKSSNNNGQWDLLLKAGTPFGDSGFRGDIKAGAVYINNSRSHYSNNNNNWDPAAGASVSYNFNRNVAMDVSYLHAFSSGNGYNSIGSDFAAVGLSYMFA